MNAQLMAHASRRRGGAKNTPAQFRIEGQTVTYADMSKRLGVSEDTARQRMEKLRHASGAITWARLEALGK